MTAFPFSGVNSCPPGGTRSEAGRYQPSGHRSDCSCLASPERASLDLVAKCRASSAFPGDVGPERAVGCSRDVACFASSSESACLESCACVILALPPGGLSPGTKRDPALAFTAASEPSGPRQLECTAIWQAQLIARHVRRYAPVGCACVAGTSCANHCRASRATCSTEYPQDGRITRTSAAPVTAL
jgi:hypothetical protein